MKFAPHFSIPHSFGAIPYELGKYEDSKVVILPVPYDGTATGRPGARYGPMALINASKSVEFYDDELKKNFSRGICTLDELEVLDNASETVQRVYEAAKAIVADGKSLVTVGGEHTITIGAVKALKEANPGLSVLHIDAHADLRDENYGNKHNHGCTARRVLEICPVVEVGIRSLSEEEAGLIRQKKLPIVFAMEMGNDKWMDEAISKLSDNVYVSIDLDCLDPGIMPAVGTPEPGGLQWYQLLKFLGKLAEKKKVVAFDIMELCPIQGNPAPDFLAAKLTYKLIGYFFQD
jgi:agmatinase